MKDKCLANTKRKREEEEEEEERKKKKKDFFFTTLVELASQLASYDKELTSENIVRNNGVIKASRYLELASSIISMHIYFMLGWAKNRMKKMAG